MFACYHWKNMDLGWISREVNFSDQLCVMFRLHWLIGRKNRGEPIDLNHPGPPPYFTSFFFFNRCVRPTPTVHLQKHRFPTSIGKKRKTHGQNGCTVQPRRKNLVVGRTGSFFHDMGPQELKTRTHRMSFSWLFPLYHSRGHMTTPLVRYDSTCQDTDKVSFRWYLTPKERRTHFPVLKLELYQRHPLHQSSSETV